MVAAQPNIKELDLRATEDHFAPSVLAAKCPVLIIPGFASSVLEVCVSVCVAVAEGTAAMVAADCLMLCIEKGRGVRHET